MGLRIGPTDLKEIITVANHDEQGSPINISGCIKTANIIVNIISSKDTDSVLNSDELKEIERFLAAHFYTFRDQQYQSTKVGDSEDRFQGKTEMYFDSSFYGQTAKMLDRTGLLTMMQDQAENGYGKHELIFEWLGRPYDQEIPFYDWV